MNLSLRKPNPRLAPPRRETVFTNRRAYIRFPSSELCLTHNLPTQSVLYPNGIPSFSPGLGGTTYPGYDAKQTLNPNGVAPLPSHDGVSLNQSPVFSMTRTGTTPLGLNPFSDRCPRVARSSQPWALWRNPFGIKGIQSFNMLATRNSPVESSVNRLGRRVHQTPEFAQRRGGSRSRGIPLSRARKAPHDARHIVSSFHDFGFPLPARLHAPVA